MSRPLLTLLLVGALSAAPASGWADDLFDRVDAEAIEPNEAESIADEKVEVVETDGMQEIPVPASLCCAADDGATAAIVAVSVGLVVGIAAVIAAIHHGGGDDDHHHHAHRHAHAHS